MADPGTYVLIVAVEQSTTIRVGALGDRSFATGHYAYVGSAFGPGGLSRVDRHRELAAGDSETRHWHIDYLLGSAASQLATVEQFPNRDIECALAAAFADADCEPVAAFGASDCDCVSHLWKFDGPSLPDSLKEVSRSA